MPKYALQSIIGNGSFSMVYKAQNIRTQKIVAIKLAKKEHPGAVKLLIREAKLYHLLKKINGIPKLQWCGYIDDAFYVVMPIYAGSLDSYRVPTLDVLYDIGNQLLQIVHHLHLYNIVHRDIKPDNIMVDNNGKMVIIDLGLCSVYSTRDTATSRQSIIGTPNYISVATHTLHEPCMKDDVESVMYVLLYKWNNNALPWSDIADLHIMKTYKESIRTENSPNVPNRIREYIIHNDTIIEGGVPMYTL